MQREYEIHRMLFARACRINDVLNTWKSSPVADNGIKLEQGEHNVSHEARAPK